MEKSSEVLSELLRINLGRFRSGAGFTVAEAARLVGVDVQALRRYERGESRLPAVVLALLAELYGRSTEDFFSPEPPPPRRAVVRPVYYARKAGGAPLDPDDDLDREMLKAIEKLNRRYAELRQQRGEAASPAREAGKRPRQKS